MNFQLVVRGLKSLNHQIDDTVCQEPDQMPWGLKWQKYRVSSREVRWRGVAILLVFSCYKDRNKLQQYCVGLQLLNQLSAMESLSIFIIAREDLIEGYM